MLNCSQGCLYHLGNDPTEHTDIAASEPDVLAELLVALKEYQLNTFKRVLGPPIPKACETYIHKYGGYYGPFIDID